MRRPIVRRTVAEIGATGRRSTRLFQTFVAGRMVQPGALGSGAADGLSAPASTASVTAAAAASVVDHLISLSIGGGGPPNPPPSGAACPRPPRRPPRQRPVTRKPQPPA